MPSCFPLRFSSFEVVLRWGSLPLTSFCICQEAQIQILNLTKCNLIVTKCYSVGSNCYSMPTHLCEKLRNRLKNISNVNWIAKLIANVTEFLHSNFFVFSDGGGVLCFADITVCHKHSAHVYSLYKQNVGDL